MADKDLIRSKIGHMQKSMSRLREKQNISAGDFAKDADAQDIVLHNLQTSIQGCIDIASHIISDQGWEVPSTLGSMFDTLADKNVIDHEMAQTMWRVVGLRNLIVHEYEEIDLNRIHSIFTNELGIIDSFVAAVVDHFRI